MSKSSTLLEETRSCTEVSGEILHGLSMHLNLPDKGAHVKALADAAPGSAFDPRELNGIPSDILGYKARWAVVRYPHYGMDWDISALRLKSLNPLSASLPWLVIVNGGSANFYEFFLDPLNAPGLGQYLAQRANVLLVSIPGNFKYAGWIRSPSLRTPEYLIGDDLDSREIAFRNAIFTNQLVLEGLRRIVDRETRGNIFVIGHSTSGELAFLAAEDRGLAGRVNGRFLGWGSGGPAHLRKAWEEAVGKRERSVVKLSKFPPLWELRVRGAREYANSGYIGPLNPCQAEGLDGREVARRWLSLVGRRRPNFKQVLQDMEHRGVVELRSRVISEIRQASENVSSEIEVERVFSDLFAGNRPPSNRFVKMVWVVAKWDKGHWNRHNPRQARELSVASQFKEINPKAQMRICLLDLPMTHYGHIEKPKELAAALLAAAQWLQE